jgi:hypothetical protein
MESFAALTTAVLYYLGCWGGERKRRERAARKAGPLLGRFVCTRSLLGWIGLLVFFAVITGPYAGFLPTRPFWIFFTALLALQFNPFSMRMRQVVEFHEGGILRFNVAKQTFTPWASVEYCRWTDAPGGLKIVLHDRAQVAPKALHDLIYVLPKGSIPRGKMEEAGEILVRHVKLVDAQRRDLNPEFQAAEQPAVPDLGRVKRRWFHFDLCSSLLLVMAVCSALSWYGLYHHRKAEEKAILAQLERVKPKATDLGDDLWLDFSNSPMKPSDGDLEPVSKLSRLTWLDLSGAPVTDSGLVHLESLKWLNFLDLSGTAVTDAGLVHLEKLTALRSVLIYETRVTDAGVKRLQQALPAVKIRR